MSDLDHKNPNPNWKKKNEIWIKIHEYSKTK